MSLSEIAKRLKRSYSTVSNTLRKAKAKGALPAEKDGITIPLSVFSSREQAPLQALVCFLKEERGMRLVDIATALHRDPRNIGDTYRGVKR
jgi:transposase